MEHVILTGASRGIGRSLALALASPSRRLTLFGRDAARLQQVATDVVAKGGRVDVVAVDFADVAAVEAVDIAADRATLIHNAGVWPSRRQQVLAFGQPLETSFVVNHLSPLLLQRRLLRRGVVDRVVVVSAGLIAAGRFDATKTPVGADFSALKTYAHTKLCAAVMARALPAARSDVDVTALHPGVVQSDLGDRAGLLGTLLRFVKRRWEQPDVTAARLLRVLQRPRATPGTATWLFEEQEQPWPRSVEHAHDAVIDATRALIGDPFT